MNRRRFRNRNKKQIPTKYMLFFMTGICVIGIIVSLIANISGGPLHTVAGYVFVPMQSGLNHLGQWASDKVNNFKTLESVLNENDELQNQVDELTSELTESRLESYDVDTYRELLDLDEQYGDYEKIAASVVACDTDNWFDVFTINKGSNAGIEVGMNVIAGSGLVGIVTEVSPNFSTVRSIIDDSSKVSAMIVSTGDNFTVTGNMQTMNESQSIDFSELNDSDDQVMAGDPVVTSYVSDRYQQGILIGYINTIETSSNNLTKSGTITPVVDFEHLTNVLVILDLKETSD